MTPPRSTTCQSRASWGDLGITTPIHGGFIREMGRAGPVRRGSSDSRGVWRSGYLGLIPSGFCENALEIDV